MKVVILCGISGSGKSTRCKEVYPDARVVSADHFFMRGDKYDFDFRLLSAAHACLREFVDRLQAESYKCAEIGDVGYTIVVDNTNTTIAEIAPYAALALAYGCDLQIEILSCEEKLAAERNVHGVPLQGIVKQAMRLETLKDSLPPWWPCKEV
jgi:predicted kinase